MRTLQLLLLIFFLATVNGAAQTATQFNSWWANVNSYKVSENIYLKSEIHIRRSDFVSDWQQFVVRPSAYYKLNDNVHLGGGYSYLKNFPYGEQPIALRLNEHQLFEDLVVFQKINKIKLLHRYRFEQRWMGNITFDSEQHPALDGSNYGNRFRYRLGLSFPLFQTGTGKRFYFTGYDELFILLNTRLAPVNLHQNWILLALGHDLTDRLKIEVGYRNQRIRKGDNLHVENNHALDVAVKYAFDFRRHLG